MYTILSSIQLTLFPEKHENDKCDKWTWQESHWNENTWYIQNKIGYTIPHINPIHYNPYKLLQCQTTSER